MPAAQPTPAPVPVRRDWRTVAGLLLGIAFGAHGFLRWHSRASVVLLCLAGGCLLLSLCAPALWAPVASLFERLVAWLLRLLTWALLLLVFVVIFVPGRLLLLLLRRDPLSRRREPARASYWESLPPRTADHFNRQY